MALQKQFVIVVFALSDPNDPEDFSYCPPGQPHWMQPTPSGPDLMKKIMKTMVWVEFKRTVPAVVVIHELYASTRDVKEFAADEDNAVAQWIWDGQHWAPHQTPNSQSRAVPTLFPRPNVRF